MASLDIEFQSFSTDHGPGLSTKPKANSASRTSLHMRLEVLIEKNFNHVLVDKRLFFFEGGRRGEKTPE